jgi:TonB family protein
VQQPGALWLYAFAVLSAIATARSLAADDAPLARIVRVVPEAIFENLRRDKWHGAPSGSELSFRALDENTLQLSKDKGWLYTPRSYYDFRLEYEMQVDKGGRHRVFFRTLNWPRQSYELRFEAKDDGLSGQILGTWVDQRNSSVRIGQEVLRSATTQHEWHSVELRCQGERALIRINGHDVVMVNDLDALGGSIGFAGHGVTYRAARVVSAPDGPAIFSTAHVAGEESLELPKVLREVRPQMPKSRFQDERNYVAMIEAVVDEQGNVAAARFLRKLPGAVAYNDEAMRAVHGWKFTPARLRGKPVPVLVVIELTFTWK